MSVLLCATIDMPGRACTLRGEHLSTCDDPDTCTGCLPYRAEVGMLCRLCDEKFHAALDITVRLVEFLASGGQAPNDVNKSRGRPGPRLPIKESQLAADSIWTHLAGVAIAHASGSGEQEPDWPAGTSILDGFLPSLELDEVVRATADLIAWVEADASITSRALGAEAAVRFYRQVQQQLHRFPLEEKPKRVPYLRCRECRQFTVVDRPPLHFLGVRVHECSNCGAQYDPAMKEFDLRLYRLEVEAAIAERSAA